MSDTCIEMINRNTGELIKVSSYTTVEEAAAIQKQLEGWIIKKAREGGKSKAFTFTKMENVKAISNKFSNVELGYFLVLQSYVDYDNLLIVSSHNKQPMSKRDIGGILRIKHRGHLKKLLDRFIDSHLLIEKEVIVDGEYFTGYYVNTDFHFKGTTRSRKIVKVFSNQVRRLYSEHLTEKGLKQPADLGFVYKISPYIHYETNILCSNPYEESAANIQKLGLNELCRITGLDMKNLQNKIKKLRWNGMTVFAKVSKGKRVHLKVNPLVFYRKDGEPDESLLADFLVK